MNVVKLGWQKFASAAFGPLPILLASAELSLSHRVLFVQERVMKAAAGKHTRCASPPSPEHTAPHALCVFETDVNCEPEHHILFSTISDGPALKVQ